MSHSFLPSEKCISFVLSLLFFFSFLFSASPSLVCLLNYFILLSSSSTHSYTSVREFLGPVMAGGLTEIVSFPTSAVVVGEVILAQVQYCMYDYMSTPVVTLCAHAQQG